MPPALKLMDTWWELVIVFAIEKSLPSQFSNFNIDSFSYKNFTEFYTPVVDDHTTIVSHGHFLCTGTY